MKPDDPLLILGVDALDWEFVNAHRDELPTLASWPVLAPLASIFPPDSIPAWTTIFTGVPPADHGALESIDYLDDRPETNAEVATSFLQGRTFWDDASRRGSVVCVVNPFLAYPAWPVNGVMVSGPVFVSGEVSVTGTDVSALPDVPELGGIVSFPSPRSMAEFIAETAASTDAQAEFGLSLLDEHRPDLFFINILTLDRLQHFAWRFFDEQDPTYPGPNPHAPSILEGYRQIDRIARAYADRGRVVILSDHGHGRRCTRMVYVDEILRRAGLVTERANGPRLLSSSYWLERLKRVVLRGAYELRLEFAAYALARRLPNRKALKHSTFSSDSSSSPARTSRIFGRNQFGGIDLAEDTPEQRDLVRAVLQRVRDRSGRPVFQWIRDREDVLDGVRIDRYPPLLFKLQEGYGVDYGMYGGIFAPDVNHRRISGGHKDTGVLACSFPVDDPPLSIGEFHGFVGRLMTS